MEYKPPISTRSKEELLRIIRSPEDWKADVLTRAQAELQARGVGLDEQKVEHKKYDKKRAAIRLLENRKDKESYSWLELGLYVVFSPISILLGPTGDSEVILYKKKRRQRRVAILLGFVLWGVVFYLITLITS